MKLLKGIASVAQSEERQSHNLKVESSNLPWSIIFFIVKGFGTVNSPFKDFVFFFDISDIRLS